jgi:hypothetical protein
MAGSHQRECRRCRTAAAVLDHMDGELRESLARMKVPEPEDDEVCCARRRDAAQSVSACCSGFGVTADLIAFTDRSAVC